jgi:hypothetical protein
MIAESIYFTVLQNVSMDLDLTEEDQMLRAIAMSLGEKIMRDADCKDGTKQKQTKEVCFSNMVLAACAQLCIIHKEIAC